MSSPPNALLIFIKNPEKGKAKTRLAATVGEEKALEVYQKLLRYTRKTAEAVEADREVWYSSYVDENDAWEPEMFTKKKQEGANLGERMKHAFRQAFEQGYERVVIIGSDCGQLTPDHLQNAYQSLENHDVVVGPSEDGGYYLLGMSRFLSALFEGKSWSTESVFDQTIADCKTHGYEYRILETLNDVDTEEDWNQISDQF